MKTYLCDKCDYEGDCPFPQEEHCELFHDAELYERIEEEKDEAFYGDY